MSNNSPEGIRLYDRIMANGMEITAQIPPLARYQTGSALIEDLRQSIVFKIQNVADYYFLHSGKEVGDWDPKDFPNLAPPYPSFFMEYRFNRDYIKGLNVPPHSVGILTRAIDLTHNPKSDLRRASNHRWYVDNIVFLQKDKRAPVRPIIIAVAALDDMGRPAAISTVGDPEATIGGTHFNDFLEGNELTEEAMTQFQLASNAFLFPALLATTFLHCKGVTINEETPSPGFSKAHQKRHGKPLVKFHTLEIRPMQEVLRREGKVEEGGLKKALHIVRGHFADYTDGRGLFGRHHGLFWMPQHLRGSSEQGITFKDYDVKKPPPNRDYQSQF